MTRPLAVCLIGVVLSMVAGCSGESGPGATPEVSGGDEATARPVAETGPAGGQDLPEPPCGAFEVDDAAAILGVEVAAVTFQHSDMLHTCNYRSESDFTRQLIFAFYREPDAAAASLEVTTWTDGFTTVATCEPVADLADEAVYCGGHPAAERLAARRGAAWVDVMAPTDRDVQVEIARRALGLGGEGG